MPRSMFFRGGGLSEFGQGLIQTIGVLYVFMILSGLACNLFAFEEGGMKTLILAPVPRRKILMGKNIVLNAVALAFSTFLIGLNEIAFRDLTAASLLFVALSFTIFAVLMSLAGNWFSIQFPKRMKFGKRMNNSGMAGLLIIPILIAMTLPPLCAVAAGLPHTEFADRVCYTRPVCWPVAGALFSDCQRPGAVARAPRARDSGGRRQGSRRLKFTSFQ